MMADADRTVLYWDPSVFLAYLLDEEGRTDRCEYFLRAAEEQGSFVILTSTLSFVEVVSLGRGEDSDARRVTEDERAEVESFFKREYLVFENVNQFIAREARELIWDYPELRYKDATHLATAIRRDVDIVHSFDDDFTDLDGEIGNPPLRIEEPSADRGPLWQQEEEAEVEAIDVDSARAE